MLAISFMIHSVAEVSFSYRFLGIIPLAGHQFSAALLPLAKNWPLVKKKQGG